MIDARLRTPRHLHGRSSSRGVRQRFTNDSSDERSAIWSPDGRRVLYTSKGLDLYVTQRRFVRRRAAHRQRRHRARIRTDWSPDGRSGPVSSAPAPDTGNDLWIVPGGRQRTGPGRRGDAGQRSLGQLFAGRPPHRLHARTSPAGRRSTWSTWTAAARRRSHPDGGRFRAGAATARRSSTCRLDRMLMSAPVESGTGVRASAPRALFALNT